MVNTSERTSKEFDFSQRYIAPFEGRVSAQARQIDIDPAWVYGLIRQESRFIMDARSGVGASGLMQVMPATAKWTAKKIGLTGFQPRDITDRDTNIAIGTGYLKLVLDNFGGSMPMAAAAYNAGEDRVRKWLAGTGGLPYETQDYVYAITGHGHDEWKAANANFDIPALGKEGSFAAQCKSLVMRELSPEAVEVKQANWKPWGVVLTAGFSQARALQAFRVIRNRFDIIREEDPLVVRKLNRSMGRRKMVRVMIGRDSRAEAQQLCRDLTARGGICLVARN
ncbi:transglycosylase SLT domain-containing protein [Aestuariivirga sp.]|uniref:transglycosylase SLT domain-containing protein n=1 Tax=Aestuariivirga sp. TaxID=2650926 RepID=UPI00301871DE